MNSPKHPSPTGAPRPYGQAPKSGGPLTTKAGARTIVFMLFGVIMLYAVFGTMFGTPDDTPAPELAIPEGIPLEPELTRVEGPTLAELLPEEVSRDLQRELMAWFSSAERAEIRDRVGVDEEEVVVRMLERDTRLKLESLPDRVYREIENVPAVVEDPAAHRGKLVAVWGRVGEIRKENLLAGDRTVPAAIFIVDAANGARFTVTSVGASDPEPGSWVKTEGTFTKLWPIEAGSDRALHLFTTRPIRKSFEPVAYQEPQVEWLTMVKDMKPSDAVEFENVPFYGMLNYIKTLGREGYEELRDSGSIDVADLRGTRQMKAELLGKPNAYRFRAVRLRGALLPKRFGLVGDLPENAGNIDSVYQGVMVVDNTRMVQLISPFPNTDFDVSSSPMADVEGFFFKRRAAEGQNGSRYWMPVILFTKIEPITVKDVSVGQELVMSILLAGAVLGGLGLLVMLYRGRREADAFRARQSERRGRRPRSLGDTTS